MSWFEAMVITDGFSRMSFVVLHRQRQEATASEDGPTIHKLVLEMELYTNLSGASQPKIHRDFSITRAVQPWPGLQRSYI